MLVFMLNGEIYKFKDNSNRVLSETILCDLKAK